MGWFSSSYGILLYLCGTKCVQLAFGFLWPVGVFWRFIYVVICAANELQIMFLWACRLFRAEKMVGWFYNNNNNRMFVVQLHTARGSNSYQIQCTLILNCIPRHGGGFNKKNITEYCQGLKDADGIGKSDPYVRLFILPGKGRHT